MRLNVVLTQIVSKHNNMAATVMNEIEARSDPLNNNQDKHKTNTNRSSDAELGIILQYPQINART